VARRNLELILARSLSENLAVPCFVVNDAGAIVWFNESGERLIGRMAPDTPELSAAEFVDILDVRSSGGEPADAKSRPYLRALGERTPVIESYRVSGADGTQVVDAAALPLLGGDGEALGVLFACYPGMTPR
jgi:PAS domain-containing protein